MKGGIKMTRIAIVDDEEEYLDEMRRDINDFYFSQGISCNIDTFSRAELLIYELEEKAYYDIYLLDIEMPQINGLELAHYIRQLDKVAYLIFITFHAQFGLKGYDYHAYQYIMKLDLKQKLIPTIASIQKIFDIDKEKFYQIYTNFRYEKIPYKDLYYIYKENKNVIFVTSRGCISIRETLKSVFKNWKAKSLYLSKEDI